MRLLEAHAPGRFRAFVGYDEPVAHRIEAGADAFVMPSRFEPCGLSQMYSLAYGTPPIVRRTGGLADSVVAVRRLQPRPRDGLLVRRARAARARGRNPLAPSTSSSSATAGGESSRTAWRRTSPGTARPSGTRPSTAAPARCAACPGSCYFRRAPRERRPSARRPRARPRSDGSFLADRRSDGCGGRFSTARSVRTGSSSIRDASPPSALLHGPVLRAGAREGSWSVSSTRRERLQRTVLRVTSTSK